MKSNNQINDPVSKTKNSSEANGPSHKQIRDETTTKQMNRNTQKNSSQKADNHEKSSFYENKSTKLQ